MSQTPSQRKAAERQRLRDAGLVAVTVWINPADRVKLTRYVKRLNQRNARQIVSASKAPTNENAP